MSKQKYITLSIIVIAVTAALFISCDSSVQFVPIKPDTSPMWPQKSFDARRSGNRFGKNVSIQPVTGASINWSDTLSIGYTLQYPSVDSRGSLYYLHVLNDEITTTLYKVNKDGKIIWKFTDSLVIPSVNNGSALSSDEKELYISCYSGLFCIDSSGFIKWKYLVSSNYSNESTPIVDKDGTIFCVLGPKYLYAISPDGVLKWTAQNAYGSPSIDKEHNIYVGFTDGNIGTAHNGIAKYSNSGNLMWKYPLVYPPYGSLIDVNGNLYLQNGDQLQTGLTSLTPEGILRWNKLFHLGDSICYNISVVPIFSSNNYLFVSAAWVEQITAWRGIAKLDTSGNLIAKLPIGTNSSFWPIDEMLCDSYDNIYFQSHYEFGSVDINLNLRFINNLFIQNTVLSVDGSMFGIYDNNKQKILNIK